MNESLGDVPWPAVRSALLDFVREHELPLSEERVRRAQRLLIIGTCLGVPYASLLDGSTQPREVAIVISGHCDGVAAGSGPAPRLAGPVEKNRLPDGWADVVVGHCVLDEFETPLTAFTEVARTATPGASLWLTGPVSSNPAPLTLRRGSGGEMTFWPARGLIHELERSGFGEVATRDLTSELLARLRHAGVARWWPAEARWVALEGRRTPGR
ncbi:MAG TPA: hypothetical protein VNN07_11210 [Candidatus Tectomicrobia bacterium]|nr:hypothetical protein [Candidatus Tectomicrobia bacterium]